LTPSSPPAYATAHTLLTATLFAYNTTSITIISYKNTVNGISIMP